MDLKKLDDTLKTLIRVVKNNKRNKEYKKLLFEVLMGLSTYVDIRKTQKWRLKELLQYLVSSNTLVDIMEDLRLRMTSDHYVISFSHTKRQKKICNSLAFE